MAVVKTIVCDVCRDITRKAALFRIGGGTSLSRIYLCPEHAEPINALLALTEKARRTYVPTTREEVAAKVAAAKKAPRKQSVAKQARSV